MKCEVWRSAFYAIIARCNHKITHETTQLGVSFELKAKILVLRIRSIPKKYSPCSKIRTDKWRTIRLEKELLDQWRMFSMFGRAWAPQKRHFLASAASLWRVPTFKSSLGAARHTLAWGALYAVLRNLNCTSLLTWLLVEQKIYVRAPHLYLIEFKSDPLFPLARTHTDEWPGQDTTDCKNLV